MKRFAFLVLVAAVHVAVAVFLYSARVHRTFGAGDAVVFVLPFAAAVIGYYLVLTATDGVRALFSRAALSVTLGAVSLSVAMLINLNFYGA